jgi:hypothetical protein
VAAEVREGIAGGRIVFAVGGKGEEGIIRLLYPSTRFGISEGTRVFTCVDFNSRDVPPGYYIGRIRLGSSELGKSRAEAGVLPALDGDALSRLCVLVPAERPGVSDHSRVPAAPIRRIPAKLSLPPGFLRPGTVMRVSAGMEKGISRGDLVVSGGYCVGRITATGLLVSSAALFLQPGESWRLVHLASSGPEPVTVEVIKRSGDRCSLAAAKPVENLDPGCLFFLPGDSCSGGELFPVCRVIDPGDGTDFTVQCGNVRAGAEEYCLVAEGR